MLTMRCAVASSSPKRSGMRAVTNIVRYSLSPATPMSATSTSSTNSVKNRAGRPPVFFFLRIFSATSRDSSRIAGRRCSINSPSGWRSARRKSRAIASAF